MADTDRDIILSKTGGGYDVFTHYFGDNIKKIFCNPYRSDSRPSCKLYFKNQRYLLRDYGASEWSGDCFHLVAMINNLKESTDFHQICCQIDKNLNLNIMDDIDRNSYVPSQPILPKEEFLKKNPMRFSAVLRNFKDSELSYWGSYGIDLKTLKRFNVSSIEKCTFTKNNGEKFTLFGSKKYPYFGYFFNEGKGVKFYRPTANNRFMYGGTLPTPYVFGYEQLPSAGDVVYITGGEKDVMSLSAHGFNAVCFNSETASLPSKLIKELSEHFKSVILLYDSDETGKKESAKRVREMNSKGYNNIYSMILPLPGTKKEKDISDFFRLGYNASVIRQLTQQVIVT